MLEFIVLGQIPGTHFVITFSWLVALYALVAGVGILRHEQRQRHTETQVTIEEQAL